MELDGRNYLMPLDATLESEATVPYELARVDDVLDELRRANGVRIACVGPAALHTRGLDRQRGAGR